MIDEKTCMICAGKGNWTRSMPAPWNTTRLLYFCPLCYQALRKHFASQPEWLSEALNSGDGVYRP